MRHPTGSVVACFLLCAAIAPAARGEGELQMSEVVVRTLAAQTILYQEVETSYAELGQAIGPILEGLTQLVKDKKVVYEGGAIFIYHGATQDPNAKFKLQVGYAVLEGTEPQGQFKVRKLEPFKAATLLYGGPVTSIDKPYQKLFGGLGANTPTGEHREYYYHFEDPDSPNNVQVLAVGVK